MMHAVFKQETAQFHRRLNSLANIRVLVKPELTASQYLNILSAFADAYRLMEQTLVPLDNSLKLGALRGYAPRLPALMEDISSLGGRPPQDQPPQARAAIPPIAAETMSHYLGLRYVLDGTSQGGRYIVQRLQKNAPRLIGRAFAFWTVQQEVAGQWPLLCERITQVSQGAEARRQMLDAAKSAYRVFIECCSSPARDP
jgi:heme oxygenase (biliverdin-IX-beta and delta-forming)